MFASKMVRQIDRWGMILLVYLLPWQARLILSQGQLAGASSELRTVSVFAVEGLLWAILAVRAASLAFAPRPQKLFFGYGKRGEFFAAAAAFVCLLFLSTIASSDRIASVNVAWRTAEGLALLFLFATAPSEREARLAFIASALVQSVLAVLQFALGRIYADSWLGVAAHFPESSGTSVIEVGGVRFLRAYGLFPHPNILAGFLAAAILSLRSLNRRFSVSAAAAYCALTVGLFLTFSRMGAIALAAGFLAQWLYARRDRLFLKYAAVSIGTFAVCAALFAPLIAVRASASGRLENKSISERLLSYSDAAGLIRKHPLAGVGAGAFPAAVQSELDPARPGYALMPAHSAPLLAWAEIGLAGLALYAWFIFAAARSAWKGGKIGLGTALIALTLFDHWTWTTYAGIAVFWAAWGLTLRGANDGETKHKAGALIISELHPRNLLLLYREGPNYNDWTFPKGHMEAGESREDTARREIKEETGLDIRLIEPLPDRDYVTGHGHPAVNHFFIARSLGDSALRVETGNGIKTALKWVDLDGVEALLTWGNLKEYFRMVRPRVEAAIAKDKETAGT